MASQPSTTIPLATSRRIISAAVERMALRCWERAAVPAEWGLSREQFAEALFASVEHRFPDAAPDDGQIEKYLEGVHAGDLALAVACQAGNEAAWEFFVGKYREELRGAARAIAGGSRAANLAPEELADSLYADLYGVRATARGRKSLFNYFHGRSKLSTWLRAVLAQRFVDEIRRARKSQPFEEEDNETLAQSSVGLAAAKPARSLDPDREKHLITMQAAMISVLTGLDARDRLRLAYYYLDGRTLAETGRLLGEHEATASRKLERTRRALRKAVESELRDGKKMSQAHIEACFACAREEWPFDLAENLRPSAETQDL